MYKRRKNFNFVDWCVMCRCCGEAVDHLLLHYEKAHWVWSFVFRSFRVSQVLPRMVSNILFGWWTWMGKHLSSIWNLDLLCLMWCIWKECNPTIKDMDSSGNQLLASFSSSLFDWSKAWGLTSNDSLPLFLNSLLVCN